MRGARGFLQNHGLAASLLAAFALQDGSPSVSHERQAGSVSSEQSGSRAEVVTGPALEVRDDRLVLHRERTPRAETGVRRELIKGEMTHVQMDIHCGWGERDYHHVGVYSPEEIRLLRARIGREIATQLKSYNALGIHPADAIRGIVLNVDGFSSPEGSRRHDVEGFSGSEDRRHIEANRLLSEERAGMVADIAEDELVRQGLEDVQRVVNVAGRGTEGSMGEFWQRIARFGRHDGRSVREQAQTAEAVVAAIHDQDAGRLNHLLPGLAGHETELEEAYLQEIASHRRVAVDLNILMKPVEVVTDAQDPILPELREAGRRGHDPHPVQLFLPTIGLFAFLARRRREQREPERPERRSSGAGGGVPPQTSLEDDPWFTDAVLVEADRRHPFLDELPTGSLPVTPVGRTRPERTSRPPRAEDPIFPEEIRDIFEVPPATSYEEDVSRIRPEYLPGRPWRKDGERLTPDPVAEPDPFPPTQPPPQPEYLRLKPQRLSGDALLRSSRSYAPRTKRIGTGGTRGVNGYS